MLMHVLDERLEPGSPEWKARRAQLLTDEIGQPLRWFYLSFADDEGFQGAAIVEACGWLHAVEKAHELGISPEKSEVKVQSIPPGAPIPEQAKDRLMSKAELVRIFGKVADWK